MGIEWLMAAAAAEHSSALQYTGNKSSIGMKQGVSQQNGDCIENQLKSVATKTMPGQMSNPYSSFSSLFQMPNVFQGSSSSSTSSSSSSTGGLDIQSTAQSQGLPSTVNNWFINALSQYSLANKTQSPNNSTSKETSNPFCY